MLSTAWYYTHPVNGSILKRYADQEHTISKKHILEVFGGSTGEVVAHFVETREIRGQRTAASVRYFDRNSLRTFIYCNESPKSGFLQKFVTVRSQRYAPTSETEQTLYTIRACFSRGALLATRVEQRTNHLMRPPPAPGDPEHSAPQPLNSDQVSTRADSDSDEALLVEAEQSGSETDARPGTPEPPWLVAQLRTAVIESTRSPLQAQVDAACRCAAAHIESVTRGNVRVWRMVAYFRAGQGGRLWFNYCTSLDRVPAARSHGPSSSAAGGRRATGGQRRRRSRSHSCSGTSSNRDSGMLALGEGWGETRADTRDRLFQLS